MDAAVEISAINLPRVDVVLVPVSPSPLSSSHLAAALRFVKRATAAGRQLSRLAPLWESFPIVSHRRR